ncbi:MAG TPA: hypothetical protein DCS91_19930 [Microcoleaceae bacterium UBA11344]|jgi:hypothetical protein|nr:hypothetical protein [Microcoleaceae cyanobacterium UBA11344]
MKNLTDDAWKNDLADRTSAISVIPDPAAWVNEHHFLANLAHTLAHLQQHFSESSWETGDSCDSGDGELAIDAKIRDILRANCSDDYWGYVEGLL